MKFESDKDGVFVLFISPFFFLLVAGDASVGGNGWLEMIRC